MNEGTIQYLEKCSISIHQGRAGYTGKVLYFLSAEKVDLKPFEEGCIVMVYPYEWSYFMTPWAHVNSRFGNTGGGGEFTRTFLVDVIGIVEKQLPGPVMERGIAGYSLGGLMSLYLGIITEDFVFSGSVSGSLWYPGAKEYFMHNRIHVERVYLSVGEQEKNTTYPENVDVKEITNTVSTQFGCYTGVKYDINEGGHFTNMSFRIMKCINYFLEM